MPYVETNTLLAALKTELESIPHPTISGERLFERVDYHENKKLREALTDLVISKQRVCIIVPGGDSYSNERQGRVIFSRRVSTLDLLIADRAWTKGGHEAVFGGSKNLGVLKMKDVVVAHLAAHPQLGLAYVALTPEEGNQIEIADDQVKDVPGRECYVVSYSTPTGEIEISPTAAWPA